MGSKWQKRYCVVRNHVLYYFKDKKAKEQAGQILLPGYKAQVANRKGREFSLTHSQLEIRAYQVRACKVKWTAPVGQVSVMLLAVCRQLIFKPSPHLQLHAMWRSPLGGHFM